MTHARESTKKRKGFFLGFADLIAPSLTKTKVYVTGGFKTVGAMSPAIGRIHGVGLGRPFCQEPDPCRCSLNGTIRGVIKQRPSESNHGLTNIIAGSQIGRIGSGKEPVDMSQGDCENPFMAAMSEWSDAKAKDLEMKTYDYVDFSDVYPI